jgi:hypothetical protein
LKSSTFTQSPFPTNAFFDDLKNIKLENDYIKKLPNDTIKFNLICSAYFVKMMKVLQQISPESILHLGTLPDTKFEDFSMPFMKRIRQALSRFSRWESRESRKLQDHIETSRRQFPDMADSPTLTTMELSNKGRRGLAKAADGIRVMTASSKTRRRLRRQRTKRK